MITDATQPQEHDGEDMQTTPVLFTHSELWVLQSFIRHELAGGEHWKFPPANLELNTMIAEALVFIEVHEQEQVALQLSLGDLLVIDYCVPNSLKDANGKPIGKEILMKSFHGRVALRDHWMHEAVEIIDTARDTRFAKKTEQLAEATKRKVARKRRSHESQHE